MSKTYQYILDFVGNNSQFLRAIDQNKSKLNDLDNKVSGSKSKLSGFFGDAGKEVLAIGSFAAVAAGAKMLVSNIIDVRSNFEKYEAVLTTSLGSQAKAAEAMKMLQGFASTTPFQLQELTGSYVKLTNYGLKPNLAEMQKYGDLASSVGKSFDQLTEAVADAVTGEYERLKEFGIKASAEGNKVTFTFKEQTTTVANNAKSIKNYILGLGELQGVQGSMASISGTLGGKLSNLKDSWDSLMNSMGAKSDGTMSSVIAFLNQGAISAEKFVRGTKTTGQFKNDIISDYLANLPADSEKAKKLIQDKLLDLKDYINRTTARLGSETTKFDLNSVLFRNEHNDKIEKLKQDLEVYKAVLAELPAAYEKQSAAESAAIIQKEKDAKAAEAAKATMGGLDKQLKSLQDTIDSTNTDDKRTLTNTYTQIAAIQYRIEQNEKLKKSIADLYADEQSGNKGMKLTMILPKQSELFNTDDSEKQAKSLVTLYGEMQKLAGGNYDTKAKLDITDMQKKMPFFEEAQKKMQASLEKTKKKMEALKDAMQSGFSEIGSSIVKSLKLGEHGLEGFLGKMLETTTQLLAMCLAASIAHAIEAGTMSALGTGFLAAISTPAFIALAVGGVLSAFAAIPSFAEGGIVYGPTMALTGEYPGANTNPEVIAPLSKLQAMIAGGGNTNITLQPALDIDGDKLRIYLKRKDSYVSKRTGV
jgi:hypothetical protein